MSLISGCRIGPYEILSAIGARGLGEVYRARDSKLKREVALKVLPEDLAAMPVERMGRRTSLSIVQNWQLQFAPK